MSSGCPIPLEQGHVADDGPRPGEIRCDTFAVLLSRLIYSMQGGCGGCEGLRMPQAVRIEWSAREAWVPYRRRVSTSDIAFSFNLTYTEPRKSYIYIFISNIASVDMPSAPPTHWHLNMYIFTSPGSANSDTGGRAPSILESFQSLPDSFNKHPNLRPASLAALSLYLLHRRCMPQQRTIWTKTLNSVHVSKTSSFRPVRRQRSLAQWRPWGRKTTQVLAKSPTLAFRSGSVAASARLTWGHIWRR